MTNSTDTLRESAQKVLTQHKLMLCGPVPAKFLYISDPDIDPQDLILDDIMQLIETHTAKAKDDARFEQMVTVLLSAGGELEITARAIRETGKDFEISTQPSSRLDGGVVYKLKALKSTEGGEK